MILHLLFIFFFINMINDCENPIKINTSFVWNVDSKKNWSIKVSEWKNFWMLFLLLFYLPFLFIIICSSFAIKCKLHRVFPSADWWLCNFEGRRDICFSYKLYSPYWSIIIKVTLNRILIWKKKKGNFLLTPSFTLFFFF